MGPESWFGLSFEPFLHIFNPVFRPADMIRMLAFKVCFLESRPESHAEKISALAMIQEYLGGQEAQNCPRKVSMEGFSPVALKKYLK